MGEKGKNMIDDSSPAVEGKATPSEIDMIWVSMQSRNSMDKNGNDLLSLT